MLNFLFIKMIPYNCCITKHQLSSLYKDWDQKEKSEKNETFFFRMEGSPRSLKYDDVRNDLLNLNDVVRIHDLRIW